VPHLQANHYSRHHANATPSFSGQLSANFLDRAKCARVFLTCAASRPVPSSARSVLIGRVRVGCLSRNIRTYARLERRQFILRRAYRPRYDARVLRADAE
jgi:hypothetical protein